MGNYVSCTLSAASARATTAPKIILPDGEVRRADAAFAAADVMIDVPGHFLVDARAMQRGRRLAALAAEEELDGAAVYVAFPMRRLNSVVTTTDMARLVAVASKETRRGAAARVRPESTDDLKSTDIDHEDQLETARSAVRLVNHESDDPEAAAAMEMGMLKHRLSVARSRRPTLETIDEENY